MKKLFFYAMMAVGMTAACQKPDVTDETDVLDDNSPVEVVFGVNAPSITVTKTKAAVENWAGEPEVFIFSGLIDGQSKKFDEPLINDAKAKVSGNNTGATVTFAGSTKLTRFMTSMDITSMMLPLKTQLYKQIK